MSIADDELERLKKRYRSIYREAARDMKLKLLDFNKRHEERDAKYRAAVKAGEMSKADYQAWLQGQVFQGEQWKKKREQMATTLFNANRGAMDILNGSRMDVFAENANFTTYQLSRHVKVNLNFGLYDKSAVQRLIKEEPDLLPEFMVNQSKDIARNVKRITRAVTQGIIQGEGIDSIAGRLADVTGMSQNAMVSYARTAVTGAQNAGRMHTLDRAVKHGLRIKKVWMATLDKRTRDAHQDLDGQKREVSEPFQSILGDIMYPGDPNADPANVVNCRCTLVYDVEGTPFDVERRDNITGEDLEYQTYKEWKKANEK